MAEMGEDKQAVLVSSPWEIWGIIKVIVLEEIHMLLYLNLVIMILEFLLECQEVLPIPPALIMPTKDVHAL